jgi:hypothetical protein
MIIDIIANIMIWLYIKCVYVIFRIIILKNYYKFGYFIKLFLIYWNSNLFCIIWVFCTEIKMYLKNIYIYFILLLIFFLWYVVFSTFIIIYIGFVSLAYVYCFGKFFWNAAFGNTFEE